MTKKKKVAMAMVAPAAMSVDLIRQAINANRGGLTMADDTQIKTLWRALDKETQEAYLKTVPTSQKAQVDDDNRPGPESDN